MRNIYTIGETVLDIVFKNAQPVAAKPGGAMLNTSVSLGRLGLPVHFISEYGNDKVGMLVDDFLKDNNVASEYVYRYSDGRTSLAMAFLDNDNNASYDFYKIYPEKRLDVPFPEVNPDDIIMFGSFYGITPEIRQTLSKFLYKAKENKALVYYDPNFRKAHLHELPKLRPLIIENMQLADIVRCSNEDMELISGSPDANSAYNFISNYCPVMIYTDSRKGVYLQTPSAKCTFDIKKIKPLSTIGAGDTFNAGIAFGLFKNKVGINSINMYGTDIWQKIVPVAVEFATQVCLSYDNYIQADYAKMYIEHKI
jgi:fructokinase